jgi:hypothetical protein
VARNVAVKLAVRENFVAVKGPQVAVDLAGGGRGGLPGSGNTGGDGWGRRGLLCRFWSAYLQCCQVAEISAKKLKRGRRKIKLAGRNDVRIFSKFYQK